MPPVSWGGVVKVKVMNLKSLELRLLAATVLLVPLATSVPGTPPESVRISTVRLSVGTPTFLSHKLARTALVLAGSLKPCARRALAAVSPTFRLKTSTLLAP